MYTLSMTRHIQSGRVATTKPSNRKRIILLYVIGWSVGIGMLLHWWGSVASADTIKSHYTVQSGETVWSVAHSQVSWEDTRNAVQDIIQLNHLKDARIYPGEKLVLPSHQ